MTNTVEYIQKGFALGEILPEAQCSLIGTEAYAQCCEQMVNILNTPSGSARIRKGFVLQASLPAQVNFAYIKKINNVIAVIVPFNIYVYDKQFSLIKTISSPYDEGALEKLKFTLFANEAEDDSLSDEAEHLYFLHPTFHPKLLQLKNDIYVLEDFKNELGPTLDENKDESKTIKADLIEIGDTVSFEATGSGNVFKEDIEGGIWGFSEAGDALAIYKLWVSGENVTVGVYRRNLGNLYRAQNSGITGNIQPSHNKDGKLISDGSVFWLYVNSGTGYARITERISSIKAKGIVIRILPPSMKEGSTAPVFTPTSNWNEGAWSEYQGFPVALTFFEERAIFGGTKRRPLWIWGSVLTEYENFDSVGPGKGFAFLVTPGGGGRILWLKSYEKIAVGMTTGIALTTPSDSIESEQVSAPERVIKDELFDADSTIENNVLFYYAGREGRVLLHSFPLFRSDTAGFTYKDLSILNYRACLDCIYLTSISSPFNSIISLTTPGELTLYNFDIFAGRGGYSHIKSKHKIIAVEGIKGEIFSLLNKGISSSLAKLDLFPEEAGDSFLDLDDKYESFLTLNKMAILSGGGMSGYMKSISDLDIRISFSNSISFDVKILQDDNSDNISHLSFTDDDTETDTHSPVTGIARDHHAAGAVRYGSNLVISSAGGVPGTILNVLVGFSPESTIEQ